MSQTYRRQLCWVSDTDNGIYFAGHNHVTKGQNKRINRRIQRRQNSKIIKDELNLDSYDKMMIEKERRELEHELWLQEIECIYLEWEDN
jgi:hypothetical protein